MSKKPATKSKAKPKAKNKSTAKFSFEGLDRVFHEKARLGILTSMVGQKNGVNFRDLKELCGLTDGNLNRHLKVLVDARIIKVEKSGRGRSSVSIFELTRHGQQSFEAYLAELEAVIRRAQSSGLPG